MQAKVLAFNKIQRTTREMEAKINEYLEGKSLKFASISESATKGKMYLSMFTSSDGPAIKAKVFRDRDPKNLDKDMNKFLESVQMKLAVQCSSSSYMTMIIFHVAEGSAPAKKAKDVQEDQQN